eukprot:GAFH01001428.1.p1 GENE.GAFH01001428.1~~GAFH01001428.1.p1  ORF type:complete len:487 (-),score=99.70 GAFH01001428.1:178-1599(-)
MDHNVVGMIFAITGNLINSISFNVQKVSQEKAFKAKKSFMKFPLWWLGLSLMLLGEFGNFYAYAWAPASLVSPLGAVSVVANAILAFIFLHERPAKWEIVGVILTIVGGAVICVFSPNGEQQVDAATLLEYMQEPLFIAYCAILVCALVALFVLSCRPIAQRQVLIYVLICSDLSSFTVMSSKGLSVFLQLTFAGDSQLGSPLLWIFAVITIVTGVTQVKYLNKALLYFRSSEVTPIYYVLYTLCAIVAGIVLYKEFDSFSALNMSMFLLGLGVTFVGVYLITHRRAANTDAAKAVPAPTPAPGPTVPNSEVTVLADSVQPAPPLSVAPDDPAPAATIRPPVMPKESVADTILDAQKIEIGGGSALVAAAVSTVIQMLPGRKSEAPATRPPPPAIPMMETRGDIAALEPPAGQSFALDMSCDMAPGPSTNLSLDGSLADIPATSAMFTGNEHTSLLAADTQLVLPPKLQVGAL